MFHRTPGTRALAAALALAMVSSALPAGAAEPAPVEPPHAARILPDSTLALLVAEDITVTKERYRETALWRFWEEPEVQAFFEPIIPKIEAIIARGEEMGEFRFADISAAFGGQVAVAFVGLDTRQAEPLPEIALIADVTDRAAAARLLARIGRAVNESTDAEFTTSTAGPLTFGRISEAGQRMEAGYVLTESALYVGLGPEGNILRTLVTAARNGQPTPLSADPDFLKAVERAGGRRDLFGYMQLRKIRDIFFTVASKTGAQENDLAKLREILYALGLSEVRSVSFVEAVDPPGFRSQMLVHAPSPRKGLFDLVSREPVRDSMLRLAPSKATSLVAFRLRMDRLLPLVREVAEIAEPGAVQQIDAVLGQVTQNLGFDVEAGVLKGLGLEGVAIVDPVATAGVGPGQGLAGLVLVMRAADPKSFEPVYEILTSLAQAQAQANGLAVAVAKTPTPDGAVVKSVAVPQLNMLGVTPAVTMTRGHLVVGLSVDAVSRICRTLGGVAPEPLVEADDYRRSLARAGEEPGWLVSFGRPTSKEDFDQLLQYAPIASPFIASAAGRQDVPRDLGDLLRAIDLTKLPSGTTLAKHGLAQIAVGWQDEDGVGITSFGPVGLSAASVAMAGLGTAAVIPQISRARARARRAACSSHLKQIGLALSLYANDNGGNYPATLAALVPGYLNDPGMLRCPASGRGYTYVAGLTKTDRPSVIVAFDAPGNHGDGANIVRVGGAVAWQRNATWVKRMVEMQVKRFERQGRNVKLVEPGEDAGVEEPEEFF
ncbi:MAG: DUF1559 family PulG-like putative transporter [Planctomycetota bacterium]|jgi:hypothetical protein